MSKIKQKKNPFSVKKSYAYKVCLVKDNNLLSINTHLKTQHQINYTINREILSPTLSYGLFVFKRLKDAYSYWRYSYSPDNAKIYFCEVTCLEKQLKQLHPLLIYERPQLLVDTPKGTYVCSSIKLLKEIRLTVPDYIPENVFK